MGYFHLVFTLPAAVADIAWQNKAVVYDILFKAAAETTLTIAADPKHLGAKVGITAVLHTWGSTMTHHPHIHMIVPGGGLSADGIAVDRMPAGLLSPRAGCSRACSAGCSWRCSPRPMPRGGLPSSARCERLAEPARLRRLRQAAAPRRMGDLRQGPVRRARKRCWPISPATLTASPSPTAG